MTNRNLKEQIKWEKSVDGAFPDDIEFDVMGRVRALVRYNNPQWVVLPGLYKNNEGLIAIQIDSEYVGSTYNIVDAVKRSLSHCKSSGYSDEFCKPLKQFLVDRGYMPISSLSRKQKLSM